MTWTLAGLIGLYLLPTLGIWRATTWSRNDEGQYESDPGFAALTGFTWPIWVTLAIPIIIIVATCKILWIPLRPLCIPAKVRKQRQANRIE